MNYFQMEQDVYDLLQKEIDIRYVYHNVKHTLDVMESVVRIAEYENLSKHDTLLLKTAALFHDIGFIQQYDDNEDISASIAEKMLPSYGYKDVDIEKISTMILMTAHPLTPENFLDKLLCDADLDYLGREDYFNKSMLLFREWREMKGIMNLNEWYHIQIQFLNEHKYYSKFSKQFREKKKNEILSEIKQLLDK